MGTKQVDVSRRHKWIYVILHVLVLMVAIINMVYFSGRHIYNETNSIILEADDFGGDFEPGIVLRNDTGIMSYEISLDGEAFDSLNGEVYVLVISRINDNAIRLWFNDQLILSEGDMNHGHSMLRGAGAYGILDAALIGKTNTIRIDTYTTYKTGVEAPMIITEEKIGRQLVAQMYLRHEWLTVLSIGLMLMAAFFALFFYIQNKKNSKSLLYLAISTVLTSLYFLDFLTIRHLTTDYLAFKKVFLLFLSLGFTFYGLAIGEIIRKRTIAIMSVVQGAVYLFLAALAIDMVQFKSFYNWWYLMVGLVVTLIFVFVLLEANRNSWAFIAAINILSIFVYSAVAMTIQASEGYVTLSSPVFYMVFVAIMPLLCIFDMVMEKNLKIHKEKSLREKAKTASLTDDLTGVWNKRYLHDLIYVGEIQSVVAMVDLDNLKTINDTYGHLAGDAVLKEVAVMIQDSIRQTDEVCRYGGDEFVVLFKGCSTEMAYLILDKVRKRVCEKEFRFGNKIIKSSVSIGLYGGDHVSSDEMLKKADEGLYKAKLRGRNCIVVE